MLADLTRAWLSLKKLPSVLGLAMVYLLWVTSANIYPVIWAYFAPAQYGWSTRMVGISLTFVGVSMALAQIYLIGRMVNRFGERHTAIVGMIAGIIGLLLFGSISNGNIALLLCLLVGIQGMSMPSINAMMSRRTPKDMQGELQGFNGSLAALAALIAPLVYNTTLSYFTGSTAPILFPGAPFMLSGAMAVCALVALLVTRPMKKP